MSLNTNHDHFTVFKESYPIKKYHRSLSHQRYKDEAHNFNY